MFQAVRQILLLRGINLGARNRIAMPALRDLLAGAGFGDVRTYLQSGNVVVSAQSSPIELATRCRALIGEAFALDVPVVVRTRDELAEVVRRNPLAEVAVNPKRYQVTFLDAELEPSKLSDLAALAKGSERFEAIGRELYAWHPEGVARSRLWTALAGRSLGATATARNWTTVTSLLELADEPSTQP